jgi:hypothetical protein
MSWHVDDATADRYLAHRLDATGAASVEAHLLSCGTCRATVGGSADAEVLEQVWTGIVDTLDQPKLGLVERALVRLGLSDSTTRALAGTSRVRWSWLAAVALSLVLAAYTAASSHEQFFGAFLVVAPLGPLLATATAFGRRSDPTYGLVATVPTSSLRLLLLRTTAAVVPAMVLTALAIPWLLDEGWLTAAWLLPSLALCLAALALAHWMPIEMAAGLIGGAWLVVPIGLQLPLAELLDVFAEPVQVLSVVTIGVAVVVTVARRRTFDYREA